MACNNVARLQVGVHRALIAWAFAARVPPSPPLQNHGRLRVEEERRGQLRSEPIHAHVGDVEQDQVRSKQKYESTYTGNKPILVVCTDDGAAPLLVKHAKENS